MRPQTKSILADGDLSTEIARRLPVLRDREMPAMAIVVPPGEFADAGETTPPRRSRRRVPAAELPSLPITDIRAAVSDSALEAIVLRFGRPSLLVRNDTFEVPALDIWRARLYPAKSKIDRAIRSVGRVEVTGIGATHLGTGWMIAPGVAVTNRHVAVLFAQRAGRGRYALRSSPIGQPFLPRLDFREEAIPSDPFEVAVTRVLYMAEDGDDVPDIAFVEVAAAPGRPLPPPIPLFDGQPTKGQVVAAIGYPAADSRNSFVDQQRIFGGIFDVKRLAPGEVVERFDGGFFSHDCSTLGGSSGSIVLDVTTGAALGLHFAGLYLEANYAISSSVLRQRLASMRNAPVVTTTSLVEIMAPAPEKKVTKVSLGDRAGFDPAFLGTGDLAVPLPRLTPGLADLAVPIDDQAEGTARYKLDYEHFSVVMHQDRRLAVFTAVNIDGSLQQRLKRETDVWAKDPRIARKYQIDNKLYAGNDLDRGHLVRRLDPTWGPTAARANDDTFFFTNCSPQHARFNQSLWAELEDYLLDSADTQDFRASVFTGPVFSSDDPPYRGVRLPAAYWKVAAMVREDGSRLAVTAYVVSQSELLTKLEFVYGQFKTYQVPVSAIEKMAGLNFGPLREYDPLRSKEATGALELVTAGDIVLV